MSVVGSVVASFTLRKNSALKPTTAGRTLDVSTGGEAGIDWANIGSPTTSVNLSATTVKTLTDAPADSSGITTLLSRVSSTRAGYLDNLSGGAVALASGVTVTTNNDKTGYSLTQSFPTNFSSMAITVGGAVTAGTVSDKTGYSLTSGGIGSGVHSAAELNNIAHGVLDRVLSAGTDSGGNNTTARTVRQALRLLRNKASVSAGTLTVTKEDDTTTSWTAVIGTTAGNPISSVDPT